MICFEELSSFLSPPNLAHTQPRGAGQEARLIASIRAAEPVVVAGERGTVCVIENRGDERNLVCFRFVEGKVSRGMEKIDV